MTEKIDRDALMASIQKTYDFDEEALSFLEHIPDEKLAASAERFAARFGAGPSAPRTPRAEGTRPTTVYHPAGRTTGDSLMDALDEKLDLGMTRKRQVDKQLTAAHRQVWEEDQKALKAAAGQPVRFSDREAAEKAFRGDFENRDGGATRLLTHPEESDFLRSLLASNDQI